MSFLRAQGHPAPNRLPICMLWHEVEIARARIHQEYVTQAVLLNSAVSAILSKDAAKEFKKLCKKLSADG